LVRDTHMIHLICNLPLKDLPPHKFQGIEIMCMGEHRFFIMHCSSVCVLSCSSCQGYQCGFMTVLF
jgi:hypothetical protein